MAMEEVYSGRKGKRCVIYIRVSSERQVQGYSLEGQERYLRDWAGFEGMTVSRVYVEPGKSGKNISGREVFQRMLEDISTGDVDTDYVVVFKLSRFGRNAKDILNSLTYIKKYGVDLICKEDGLDSSTAMGRMMITILGAVAEMERENILVQTMLGRAEKAKQGGWNGGSAPYGYELVDGNLAKKEDEAQIVRLIFDKFVNEGMGYTAIVGYLNRQGVPRMPNKNSHGRKFTDWSVNHVKRILDNPVYTGRIAYGRTRRERVPGTEDSSHRVRSQEYTLSDTVVHEALVSDNVFEKAQARLRGARGAGKPAVGRSGKYLLSGILRCPMCGSSMYGETRYWKKKDGTSRQRLYYQCGHYAKSRFGQCSKNSIRADRIETEVLEYTRLLVSDPKFAEDIQRQIGQRVDTSGLDEEIHNYQGCLARLERSKANLERDIDNIVDDDRNAERKRKDMNSRLDKIYDEIYDIEGQIKECEDRRAAAEKDILTTENIYKMLLLFDEMFDKMDWADQRKLIESLISEIHLYPKETWNEDESPIREIRYAFPVDDETLRGFSENLTTVRTGGCLQMTSGSWRTLTVSRRNWEAICI